MTVRVVDLFSGAGGTSCGLRQAGMMPVAAVDIDAGALATYARNFPEARTFAADIRTVAVEEISAAVAKTDGSLLMLAACAPCLGRLRSGETPGPWLRPAAGVSRDAQAPPGL